MAGSNKSQHRSNLAQLLGKRDREDYEILIYRPNKRRWNIDLIIDEKDALAQEE